MNYEVGKYYRTRDGHRALCIYHRPQAGDFCFLCVFAVECDGNIAICASDSRFCGSANLPPVRIVGPWIDKPVVDWSKMPAWAQHVMQDRDGNWFWFNDALPKDMSEMWSGCTVYTSGMIPPEHAPTWTGDWKDSLVERPKI